MELFLFLNWEGVFIEFFFPVEAAQWMTKALFLARMGRGAGWLVVVHPTSLKKPSAARHSGWSDAPCSVAPSRLGVPTITKPALEHPPVCHNATQYDITWHRPSAQDLHYLSSVYTFCQPSAEIKVFIWNQSKFTSAAEWQNAKPTCNWEIWTHLSEKK